MKNIFVVAWWSIKAFYTMVIATWLIIQGRWFVFRSASDLTIIILYRSLQYEELVDDGNLIIDRGMQSCMESYSAQLSDEYNRRKTIRNKQREIRRKTQLWI